MCEDKLRCGQCGETVFFIFGPYHDDPDGLKMIYTCTGCGNQVREYNGNRVVDMYTKEERQSILRVIPEE